MKKIALITGITGQDGSFLAEFLLEKGYDVHGTIRRSSVDFRERIAHLEGKPNFHLHYADLGDSMSILQVSELYGKVEEVPQNENTPFHPYSPYAVAKLYGYWIVREYREAYNMFCCSGILFKQEKLSLGNLDSLRDWGYAKDYVECMWLILQHETPEDFVIATGVQHSVREFCYLAFKHAGIELEFRGEGINEKGYDRLEPVENDFRGTGEDYGGSGYGESGRGKGGRTDPYKPGRVSGKGNRKVVNGGLLC